MAGLLANLDALVYGLVIFAAMLGWGIALARLLYPQREIEWGIKAAWGTALTVAIGGFLDFLQLISRMTIFAWLGIGLVFLLLSIARWFVTRRSPARPADRVRGDRAGMILCVILVLVVLCQYGGWVVDGYFNEHDDLQAYLVFPQKMVQTGHQGIEPFCERRIETSLGGQWFLVAIALAHVPEPYLHLIDPGLGFLLLAALICSGAGSWLLINTSLAFLIFLMPPVANVTMLAIGAALFLTLFRTIAWFQASPPAPLRNALIVSLLTVALMTGKSTLVPACGAFLVLSYLWRIFQSQNRKPVIAETALAIIFSFALLAPWMISMYRSCHTPFYPFFGKGYHASRYGTYEPSWSALLNVGYDFRQFGAIATNRDTITIALLIAAAWVGGLLRFRGKTLLPIVLCVPAGMLTIFIGGGGYGANRYSVPFLFAAVLFLLNELWQTIRTPDDSRRPAATTTMLVLVCVAAGFWMGGDNATQIMMRLQSAGAALKAAMAGSPVNAGLRSTALEDRYAAMQNSIPAGATLLCRLEKPYLLNFKRNQVFIIDYPGGQSLPPGMPIYHGSEALADYFISLGFRYLAYSYATQALFTRETFAERISPNGHPWIRSEALCTFDFQDNVLELRKSRKSIYDDGDICVLDLAERK